MQRGAFGPEILQEREESSRARVHQTLIQFEDSFFHLLAHRGPWMQRQKHVPWRHGRMEMLGIGPKRRPCARKDGQPVQLKGGAGQDRPLIGGSGQAVHEDWQTTQQTLQLMLEQSSTEVAQMPPLNVERHGMIHLYQSPQWQSLAGLIRAWQTELVQFAYARRALEQGELDDISPRVKRQRIERLTALDHQEFRLALCNILEEVREFQEDVLETLRARDDDITWSRTRAFSRALRIMLARLRESTVFQTFTGEEPEAVAVEEPLRVPMLRQQLEAPSLSRVQRHLLQQVLANTGNVCYVNSILRTWVWTMEGIEEQDTIGHLIALHDILTEGPTRLCLTEQPVFQAFAREWLAVHDQHDAGEFLGYLMAQAQAPGFTCTSLSVFEHDPVTWMPIYLPFAADTHPTNLQDLVDRWSNDRSVVVPSTPLLAFRLGRYSQTAGGWGKHHSAVTWQNPMCIPQGWAAGEDGLFWSSSYHLSPWGPHSWGSFYRQCFQRWLHLAFGWSQRGKPGSLCQCRRNLYCVAETYPTSTEWGAWTSKSRSENAGEEPYVTQWNSAIL